MQSEQRKIPVLVKILLAIVLITGIAGLAVLLLSGSDNSITISETGNGQPLSKFFQRVYGNGVISPVSESERPAFFGITYSTKYRARAAGECTVAAYEFRPPDMITNVYVYHITVDESMKIHSIKTDAKPLRYTYAFLFLDKADYINEKGDSITFDGKEYTDAETVASVINIISGIAGEESVCDEPDRTGMHTLVLHIRKTRDEFLIAEDGTYYYRDSRYDENSWFRLVPDAGIPSDITDIFE